MSVLRGAGGPTRLALGLLLGLAWAAESRAGGGPANVVVVVNGDSWASLAVANEFIHLRRIPPANVVYVDGLPDFEHTDVEAFRQRILAPVLEAIAQRKLADQIDYIVYSADLPFAIHVGKDVGERKLPPYISPVASINGLTYLFRFVMAKSPAYLRLDANRYMRWPLASIAAKPLDEDEQERYDKAMKLLAEKKWADATPILAELAKTHPHTGYIEYNLACGLALLKKPDEAMAALRRALDGGWLNARHTATDDDLASLRNRKDFKQLLEDMKSRTFDVMPSRAFRSAYQWNERGEIAAAGGTQYMLSTMLAVTSGRGNSVREALECLRRSASADGSRPRGTIYYMTNGDIRSTTRDWSFKCAQAKLRDLGVEAAILPGVLPPGKPDVQGAMIGAAGFDWKASGSTIRPGAICEHLTSCGGMMGEYDGQTPLTELIRCGAAGASGTVTEPYAIQAKFPTAFLHVHYAAGCSLAEAFYQSVHGPYQLLIVGDPLCRPWARRPRLTVEGIKPGAMVKGRLRIKPKAFLAGYPPVGHFELFMDDRRVGVAQSSQNVEIDTAQAPDGYHELRVVAVAATAIETQAEQAFPIEVRNRGLRLDVLPPASTTVAWDRPLELKAKLPGAAEITFLHNARPLGTIQGEQGQVMLDLRRLGQGRVAIQAVGKLKTPPNALVSSRPIELQIVPPPPLPAVKLDPAARFAKGLQLIVAGAKRAVVEDTRPGDWLAKAVKAGETFELAGYFAVPAADVYQFQVKGNVQAAVEVDSTALGQSAGERWTFLPVALGAGTHRLCVRGKAPAKPYLDIRFGGPGAYRLSGSRFRHVVGTEGR